ncbi:MAG: formate--tetrahydrofolate ligase [Formivibrio sp.]|nr:formate--tetrahydrofolate ligase [Formivibrio sp.]
MSSDSEIAQTTRLRSIIELAGARLGIPARELEPYGHYKAKLSLDYIEHLRHQPDGKLILVTAITPTPAGEGKTTTTIGLADALNRLGKNTLLCLREPSLGPCFGLKGGATGGGHAQVAPMSDINLHFTGDFHAVTSAHNLLSAHIDNHLFHGNALGLDPKRIVWRRVIDMNDRALRHITIGQNGLADALAREEGFDLTVASEVMAALCLAESLDDLHERLGNMLIGYGGPDGNMPFFARDLKVTGAMTALLKDALKPNLVQTLENNPALIHGGPFANIAHGCNSLIATRSALKLADYVVTEAGFGADLGAEKFINIKCRQGGLKPALAVLVASARALKSHGGAKPDQLEQENSAALLAGMANLLHHHANLREQFGLPVVVAINPFPGDTPAELALLLQECTRHGLRAVVSYHWAEGGAGAEALALAVLGEIDHTDNNFSLLYPDDMPLRKKIARIASRIYGANGFSAPDAVLTEIDQLDRVYRHFPICMAKTPYSFTGAAPGQPLPVHAVRLARGAGFLVVLSGKIMTMPGLPEHPASERIDVLPDGRITGLQ